MHNHQDTELCPICEHYDFEHQPTWDGRLKCAVCDSDAERDDCFIEVTREMYQERLRHHLEHQVEQIEAGIMKGLDTPPDTVV